MTLHRGDRHGRFKALIVAQIKEFAALYGCGAQRIISCQMLRTVYLWLKCWHSTYNRSASDRRRFGVDPFRRFALGNFSAEAVLEREPATEMECPYCGYARPQRSKRRWYERLRALLSTKRPY